jgi:hypothetical protein
MKKTSTNNLEYLDISPTINALEVENTPFLSYLLGAGKTAPANSTEIKWREYEINKDDSSGQLEGGEFTDAESGRVWNNNLTEIFRKATSVSGTLDAINVNGIGNELTNQVSLRGREMKIDLNRKLITGVKADQTSTKGRQMNGIMNLINAANVTTTAVENKVTRKDVDKMFKLMYDKGYMGQKLCLVSADMLDLLTDEVDGKTTKIAQFGNTIQFGLRLGSITSNYGTGIALLEPALPNGSMVAVDTNYIKLRPLREWRAQPLPQTTDSKRIGLVGEYTIEYNASNSGAILNLAQA